MTKKSPLSGKTDGSEKESFRQQLRVVVDQSGLSLVDFARLLEAEARTPVSSSRLSSWLRGKSSPRTSDLRYSLLTGAFKVQKILELDWPQQEREFSAARWISGAEVRAHFEGWLKQGLTFRQVILAGQISDTVGALWRSGTLTRVDRPRFERFRLYVDYWLGVLRDNGALDYVAGDQVSGLMQEWGAAGLSADEIRIIAEIPLSFFSKWQTGQPVPQTHFERVKLIVNHWVGLKLAREADGAHPAGSLRTTPK